MRQSKDLLLNTRSVKDCLDYPTIKNQIAQIGAVEVIAMAYAEVEKGLKAFNVIENMSPDQIEIFVDDFLDQYSYESIADLKICLKNARLGKYGANVKAIDQLTLMTWFGKFLEEKADARAAKHQKIKTEPMGILGCLDQKDLDEIRKAILEPKQYPNAHTNETAQRHMIFIQKYYKQFHTEQLEDFMNNCKRHNQDGIYDDMIKFIQEEIERRK